MRGAIAKTASSALALARGSGELPSSLLKNSCHFCSICPSEEIDSDNTQRGRSWGNPLRKIHVRNAFPVSRGNPITEGTLCLKRNPAAKSLEHLHVGKNSSFDVMHELIDSVATEHVRTRMPSRFWQGMLMDNHQEYSWLVTRVSLWVHLRTEALST